MRKMKRVLALTLIIMMVLSSLSFAQPSEETFSNDLEEALRNAFAERNQEDKLIGFESVDLKSKDDLRVIVEFYNAPVIEKATSIGLHVADMDSAVVSQMTAKIHEEQASTLNIIQKEVEQVQVHQQFSNVFNGMSMTVSANNIEAISKIDGVKAVYIANEYLRPEPQMSNSDKLTQSTYVNEVLNYKGEGLVVAIIDSGLDPYHEAFNIDDPSRVKYTQADIDQILANNQDPSILKGKYYSLKVPYGYNYMDQNYIIQDIAPGASMHGMHVGGTVAANGIIKGVAPNAQLLGLKVFGNDPQFPSTYADIIIAAVDDGIALGADVMNLSLGATAANVNRQDPEQQSITRAVENGILMSISAGNSAHFGNGYSAQAGFPWIENPDIGLVGSPGLTQEALTVASVDNFTELNAYAVGHETLEEDFIGYASGNFVDGSYELATIGGSKIGVADDFEGLDLTGKVALVNRGNMFTDTAINAKAAGAIGVIVINASDREIVRNLVDTELPFMMIPNEGKIFEEIIGELGSTQITINYKPGVYSPSAGKLSSFSSWGTTPDLGFKPNIAAPGGNIYSTFENDTYGFMSGTSMAAPHAAGGAALVYQRLLETNDFSSLTQTEEEFSKLVRAIMMNTGRPVTDANYGQGINDDGNYEELTTYTSPRRQGAGSMDLKSATETDVVVYATESGRNYEAFYNAGEVSNGFDFELTAFNQGETDKYYSLEAVVQTNLDIDGFNFLESMVLLGTSYSFTVGGQPVSSIVVPAGQSVDVKVSIDLTNAILGHTGMPFNQAYPNGNFVEGFVFFYEGDSPDSSEVLALKAAYLEAAEAVQVQNEKVEKIQKQLENQNNKLEKLTEKETEAQAAFDVVNNIKLALEALDAAEVALEDAEAALETYILENGTLEENQADLDDLYAHKAALEALAAAEEALVTAQENLATENEALVSLNESLVLLQGQIDDKKAELDDLDPESVEFKEIQAALAELRDQEETLLADILAKEEEVTVLEDEVTAKETAVAEAQELVASFPEVEDLEGQIETVEGMIEMINTLTAAVEAAELALEQAQVDFTEEELASLETLGELELALQAAKEAVEDFKEKIEITKERLDKHLLILQPLLDEMYRLQALYIQAAMAERSKLPLSVPFISFKGDWAKAPAFDGLRGTADSYYNLTTLLYNNLDDPGYFMDMENSAFSPNGDGIKDEIASIFSLFRNLVDVEFEIQDENHETIFTIGSNSSMRKNYYDGGRQTPYYYNADMIWRGIVNYQVAPEGLYYYVVKGKLADGDENVKELRLPVLLDITSPEFLGYEFTDVFKANFIDNLSGISYYSLINWGDNEGVGFGIPDSENETGEYDLSQYAEAGDHISVIAYDHAGNYDISPIIKIDDVMPELTVDTPEFFGSYTENEILVQGSVYDESPFSLYIGEDTVEVNEDGTFEYTYVAEADGLQNMFVKAIDIYGNENAYNRKFFVDTQAPEVEIVSVKLGDDLLEVVDGKVQVPVGTTSVDVTVKASDNYPELLIKINDSKVAHIGEGTAWYHMDSLLKPVEHQGTYTINLFGFEESLPVVVEVTDAMGLMTEKSLDLFRRENDTPVTPEPKPEPTPNPVVPAPTPAPTPVIPTPVDEEFVILEDEATPLGAVNFVAPYMNGFGDGTFKPEAMITRAQLAKIYVNILGLEIPEPDVQAFNDVSKEHWAFAYVHALKDAGIIKGYGDGTFKPDQTLKLGELAQTFTNYWAYLDLEVSDEAVKGLEKIEGHWSAASIYRLFNAEVVDEALLEVEPESYVNRGKIVIMINRLLGRAPLEVEKSKFEDVTDPELIGAIEAATSPVLSSEE